jgi:hypothetical protein
MIDERLERLYAMKAAAEQIADERTPFGKRARSELAASTGLSTQSVSYALGACLEHHVSRATLSGMCRQVDRISRAHVILSSNVFVANFRAIMLALAQSTQVHVAASRREPVMAQLLLEASRGAFQLVPAVRAEPGDHVWAYGSDDTLTALKASLIAGVHFHGHGYGMGAAVFRETKDLRKLELKTAAANLALDVVAFDQRGCLSPRVLLIEGSRAFAETTCDFLVEALSELEGSLPRGTLSADEQADARWHETTMTFLGSSVQAGKGMVFLDPVEERLILPPIGRYLHVATTQDPLSRLTELGPLLTTVGFFNEGSLPGMLRAQIGDRRYVSVGQMQRPPLDGPVDLRSGFRSILL